MSKNFEEPIEKVNDTSLGGITITHPAYAQIGASRVTGNAYLYGSDFNHNGFITISIHASELNRSLSIDWPFARQEYIEVMLSEAQWASFVSSLNCGQGTQCTLNHLQGKGIPQIPGVKNKQEVFESGLRVAMQEAQDEISKISEKINQANIGKKVRDDLIKSLELLKHRLTGTPEFISEQFGEHMEHVVESAKIEVNAYVQSTVTRAGLKALGAPLIELKSISDQSKSAE